MYVLLGSNGNITSKAAALLLARNAAVRVVGRNANSLLAIKAQGAEIATGDIGDASFLSSAFEGASAVYAMIPTDYAAQDMAAAQDRLGEAIARAIAAARVKRVVNLSSVGAHSSSKTGPIAGLHRQERRLNELTGVEVLHLRPGYFFENHLAAIEMIPAIGAYADMTAPDSPLPMVATADVARVLARELCEPIGAGKHVLHLRAPRLYTMRESAALIGKAIGRPELTYVQLDPEQGKAELMKQGFSADAAAQMEEMSVAFSTGRLDGEYEKGPTEISQMTLESFVSEVFKPAFAVSGSSSVLRANG